MVKYFKIVLDGEDYIIPVDGIIGVSQTNTATVLTYSILAHDNATTPEFVKATLTAAATLTADEQSAQKSAVIEAIAEALSTAWTKPLYTLTLPSALDTGTPPELGSGTL